VQSPLCQLCNLHVSKGAMFVCTFNICTPSTKCSGIPQTGTYLTLCIIYWICYATSVAGQTCSFSGNAAKGGSQYLCLNENVSLLRHRQFYPSDMASLAWPTSRVGKTCFEDVWTTTGLCDMKNLPRSLSRRVWHSGLPFRTIPREHWLI